MGFFYYPHTDLEQIFSEAQREFCSDIKRDWDASIVESNDRQQQIITANSNAPDGHRGSTFIAFGLPDAMARDFKLFLAREHHQWRGRCAELE